MEKEFFSASQKDFILNRLVPNKGEDSVSISPNMLATELNIPVQYVFGFLVDLNNAGIIRMPTGNNRVARIEPASTLFDLLERGGFSGELAQLKIELEKLELELKSLKSRLPGEALTSLEKVTNLLSNAVLFIRHF